MVLVVGFLREDMVLTIPAARSTRWALDIDLPNRCRDGDNA